MFAEGTTVDEAWVDKFKQKRITKSVRVDTYRVIPTGNDSPNPQAQPDNLMNQDEVEAYFNGSSL